MADIKLPQLPIPGDKAIVQGFEPDDGRLRAYARKAVELNTVDEIYVDSHGVTWTRPTAWAWAMLCGAYDRYRNSQLPLIALLNTACTFLDGYCDAGPEGEGWQSDQLVALIKHIREVTSGAVHIDEPDVITARVGRWLSAALSDPTSCQEFKDDIVAWMEAGQPNVQPAEPDDVTTRFMTDVTAELARARAKFPGDRVMMTALAEEFGELAKALLDEPGANVWKEAVQTAVMAARVAVDGDGSVDDWRAAKGLDNHRNGGAPAEPVPLSRTEDWVEPRRHQIPREFQAAYGTGQPAAADADYWRTRAIEAESTKADDFNRKLARQLEQEWTVLRGMIDAEERAAMTPAARDVLAERRRHVTVHGWTPEKDNTYRAGTLANAGQAYVTNAVAVMRGSTIQPRPPTPWPWTPGYWRPTTPRRDLVKAAALILAEIERLDRKASKE